MKEEYILRINETDILVQRKKIKNLYLRIDPSTRTVRLSAPRRLGSDAIRAFAQSRMAWMEEKLQKAAPACAPQYQSGDKLYLWGEPYALTVLSQSGKPSVRCDFASRSIVIAVPPDSDMQQRMRLWEGYLRMQLAEKIPEALARCEVVTGAHAEEWHIKKMKTRWGSCNVLKKRIWINEALAAKAPICLDYILTHELTHLYERKHNAAFKAHMDRFFPAWREVRRLLNEGGAP